MSDISIIVNTCNRAGPRFLAKDSWRSDILRFGQRTRLFCIAQTWQNGCVRRGHLAQRRSPIARMGGSQGSLVFKVLNQDK
jgi:hypothetical protein